MATKQNSSNDSKKNTIPAVDPMTCAHGRTEELKNGGRVCLSCGEKLLDEKTQQLCDAIARGVVRAIGRKATSEKEPEKKRSTLYDKLFGPQPNPNGSDEDTESGED
jgi:hypothetical protein